MDSKIETIAKSIRRYRIEDEHLEFVQDEIDGWNTRVRAVGDKIPVMEAHNTMVTLNKKLADAKSSREVARRAARALMDSATQEELAAAKLLVKNQYEMLGNANYIPSHYNYRWSGNAE